MKIVVVSIIGRFLVQVQIEAPFYEQFLKSSQNSVTKFAKEINSSQPRLTMLWKKHIPEYAKNKKHGKIYKKSL
jgi:hypothetical protein